MEIAIIGAGPAGCYTALLLNHYGFDPLLIEEHEEAGRPIHIEGIMRKEVFTDMFLPISQKSIKNNIDKVTIYYEGNNFSIRRKNMLSVIDREVFDKELSKGLNIKYDTKFLDLEKEGSGYLIKTDKGIFYSDIIIGADGPISQVRRAAKLAANIKYYSVVLFRIRTKAGMKNLVEVHFKEHSSSYSWVIPESDEVIRVGTILDDPHQECADFIDDMGIKGEFLDEIRGISHIGYCETVKDNVALVGKAACQVKPLGGGIYCEMKAAEVLAKCIKDKQLYSYEQNWKKVFGKVTKPDLIVHQIFG